MRRLILAIVLLGMLASRAHAADVYFAQSAAGGNNGTSCSNAYGITDATHGINVAGNWVGGNTLHLCGTITGGPNVQEIIAQAGGSNGNPITIQFEPGAVLTSPYWNVAINLGGFPYITVNGGTNGIIENTANGSGLTYQQTSMGVYTTGGNVIVENLAISNLYIHNNPSDTTVDQTQVRCVFFSGSNVTIANNVMHDAGWCLFQSYNNGDANVNIYNNEMYNIDHGWMVATGHTGGSSGPFSFHDNYVHDYANWDTTTGAYHHDGIHCFTEPPGAGAAHITALNIYNNLFNGGPITTTSYTSHIFLEGGTNSSSTPCMDSTSNAYIYNNVLIGNQPVGNGLLGPYSGSLTIYNNTMIDNNPGDLTNPISNCFATNSAVNIELFMNNVMSGCDTLINIGAGVSSLTLDYNVYANGGSNSFINNGTYFNASQFSNWKSSIGGDSHSSYKSSAGLTTAGVVTSGAPVIGVGTNFTSLCGTLTALCRSTSAGNTVSTAARPSTGAWTVGAFLMGNGAQNPNPPSGLASVAH